MVVIDEAHQLEDIISATAGLSIGPGRVASPARLARVIHTPAALALATLAFGLIVAGVPFPLIIALAALAGYLAGTRRPGLLGKPSDPGSEEDEADKSSRETGLRRRFVKTLLLWLVPLAALLLAARGLVAELAGFFTLAALITFGGAYAVLPFVADCCRQPLRLAFGRRHGTGLRRSASRRPGR